MNSRYSDPTPAAEDLRVELVQLSVSWRILSNQNDAITAVCDGAVLSESVIIIAAHSESRDGIEIAFGGATLPV